MKIKKQLVTSTKLVTPGKNPGKYLAMHETANTSPSATAQSHADLQSRGNSREVSWHWQVDEDEAIQSFRNDQKCWHAGDGLKGRGLNESIAIEVCVNGDVAKAWDNAARLAAHLLQADDVAASTTADIEQHFNFSGKNCPSQLRAGKHGLSWQKFLNDVKKYMKEEGKPVAAKRPYAVSPHEGRFTSGYNPNRYITLNGRRVFSPHLGLDIAPPVPGTVGTPVYAMFSGTVTRVVSNRRPGQAASQGTVVHRGYSGNGIEVRNPDKERQLYIHVRPTVKKGQKVKAGDLIGHTDRSGIQTGPHLHLSILNKSGVEYDPMLAFRRWGITPGEKPKFTTTPSKPAPSKPSKPSKPSSGGGGKGLSSSDKKAIQRALARMGYDVGPADGVYGDRTTREVMNYQRDLNHYAGAGLVVDGGWGTVVQRWYDWVKQLQRALPAWRGVPKLVVDGGYQRLTSNAVKTLQRNNGLHPDGKAGPITCAYMRKHGSNIPNPPKNRP